MFGKIMEWVSLGITAATTLLAIILYFINRKKKNTSNELAEQVIRLQEVNNIAKILQKLPELINKAEKTFPSGDIGKFGPAKLMWVLGEVEKLCLKHEVEYNEDQFTVEIEKILETPQKKEEKASEI